MSEKSLHVVIADERGRRGWTQQEAADAVGMSLRAYANFEAGRTKPQGKNLRGILRAFGLDGATAQGEPAPVSVADWPTDVRAFQNMIGAFLMTMSEAEREAWIFAETRRIFESVHNQVDRGSV